MADRVVAVWWLDTGRVATPTSALLAILGPREVQRAAGFRADRDRRRYVVRHAWARERIALRLGVRAADIGFALNRWGKPRVRGAALGFSLSHANGVAMLALVEVGRVGCDIAWRDPGFDPIGVATCVFSTGERAALAALPAAEQAGGFWRAWTRKEAYVKARGRGLSIPLESFDVDVGDVGGLGPGCDGWSAVSLEPRAGFCAAVVAQRGWRLVMDPPH